MFNLNFSNTKLIAFNPDISYAEFAKQANLFSQSFQILGIQKLALFIENSIDLAMLIVAAIDANIDILLPPNLLAENQQWIKENSDYFLNDKNLKDFKIIAKNNTNPPVISAHSKTKIYLKTSGSSGNSKIICKNIQQILLETQALNLITPPDEDLYLIRSVTCQHCYGLSFALFLPLYKGWSMHPKQLLFPEYLIEESTHHSNNIWISSPALLSNININNPHLKDAHIKTIISSGGALPSAVNIHIRENIPCSIIEIYGSTETGAIAQKINHLWQPLNGLSVGTDQQDALWVSGAWVEEKQQTADVIKIKKEGFQLLGRIDRIVKIGDKRISLAKIEQELLKHPEITDVFIALHPQKQRPAAWIALTPSGLEKYQQSHLTFIKALKSYLRSTTENLAIPRFWRFTDKLPRNTQSKIRIDDFNHTFICKEENLNERT